MIIEEAASRIEFVTVNNYFEFKVDVDQIPSAAQKFKVTCKPKFVLYSVII